MKNRALFAFAVGVIVFIAGMGITEIQGRRDELNVILTYDADSRYVVVSAKRLSKEHEAISYEFRGPELLTLIDKNSSEESDELIFEVSEEGSTEMIFYSINPATLNDTYSHAYRCEISVSADVIDLDKRLWRR